MAVITTEGIGKLEKQQARLLVFDDQVYRRIDDLYSSEEAHLLFMNATRDFFDEVVLLGRQQNGTDSHAYTVQEGIEVFPLPYYDHLFNLYTDKIHLRCEIRSQVMKATSQADLSLTSWPHPVSLAIINRMCALKKLPVILISRGCRG